MVTPGQVFDAPLAGIDEMDPADQVVEQSFAKRALGNL
jgi:hypothetical protein